mmetsp:Transcript_25299/g.36423  ORF Transcript_25299/g.36423 Transcript_25299/m.36423 type:complete len:91 (+) Transcript_25299:1256-1528(+)|eukprot:CAMPEP_0184755116 /NCGR_PEP_ID=MMETSP0315-20130426/44983_1 /TAXON_ID=101924 /ORGANISM="Rhodosorus marinus, Strain UTEX LB 2760" /LENGTH=90 /DNA_ID=CAMNT_0027234585 /DNA_START=1700 /DNA_END=1972 /DNA_ORIENTATION=-
MLVTWKKQSGRGPTSLTYGAAAKIRPSRGKSHSSTTTGSLPTTGEGVGDGVGVADRVGSGESVGPGVGDGVGFGVGVGAMKSILSSLVAL